MARRLLGVALAAAGLVALAAQPAAASDKGWRTVANVGVAALIGGAAADTALHQDWTGGEELALSLGVNEAATWGLKHTVHEWRPNHRDRRSFPSAHTSRAFAAATYLEERYGWQAGAPALAVATLVGVARVASHDHHWYDVAAGAGLGAVSATLFTRPFNSRVTLTPWADGGGAGLTLAGAI